MTDFLAISHPHYVGHNQAAEGLCQSLTKAFDQPGYSVIPSFTRPPSAIHAKVIIGAGAHCIPLLSEYKKQCKHIVTIWAGHQVESKIWQNGPTPASHNLDYIILPKALIRHAHQTIWQHKLLSFEAVPHNWQKSDWQDHPFQLDQNVINFYNQYSQFNVCILGGDGKNQDNKMKYFTKNQAQELAKQLVAQHTQPILILDCPRTGLYQSNSEKKRYIKCFLTL